MQVIPPNYHPFTRMLPSFFQNLVLQKAAQKFRSGENTKQMEFEKEQKEESRNFNLKFSPNWQEVPQEHVPAGSGPVFHKGKFYIPRRGRAKSKLQRKTRHFWEGGKQWAQDYNFDPSTGAEESVGERRIVYNTRQADARLQKKRRIFVGEDGKPMAQEYTFNPKTGKERSVGKPYEVPKTMGIMDFLLRGPEGEEPSNFVPGVYRTPDGKEVMVRTKEEYDRLNQ